MLEQVRVEIKNSTELNNLDNMFSVYGIGSIAKKKTLEILTWMFC